MHCQSLVFVNMSKRRSLQMLPSAIMTRKLIPSDALIDDEKEREVIYTRMMELWCGGRTRSSVLGSNPISLSRNMLKRLEGIEYLVALKSDGVRYTLFLTMREDGVSALAVMIDRAKMVFEVDVFAPEDFFLKGTILEGELVWQKPTDTVMSYIVFDAVRIRGEVLTSLPFSERLKRVEACTSLSEELSLTKDLEELSSSVAEENVIVMMNVDPRIIVSPKRFVPLKHASSVWRTREDASHRVDGLIIQRSDSKYRNGRALNSTFKWKPVHTIDLSGFTPNLRCIEACVDDTTFQRRRVVVAESKVVVDKETDVAEYMIDVSEDFTVRLFAIRSRPDKCVPNSLEVVRATFQDALENITPEEMSSN